MRYWKTVTLATVVALGSLGVVTGTAEAASSGFCDGGGFTLTEQNGTMLVRGRHVGFDLDLATGAVLNWTLTGAANSGRLVDQPTVIFLEKTPLHGTVLTRNDRVRNDKGDLIFTRTNGAVSVKIQAKDCAQGGIFQMEVSRADGQNTRVRHVLAPDVFFYDNPNFRDREGDIVPFSNSAGDTALIAVSPRVNFGSDPNPKLVGRDSPQAANRIPHDTCLNQIPTRFGTTAPVRHCGGVSEWDVLSGGRLGQVMGEDSTEVAPPATFCTKDCQAQNQVRGGAVVLGHPASVPEAYRLKPRTP